MEANNFPLWYLVVIAVIGGLPATLTALGGLIYVIKLKGGQDKLEANLKGGQDKIEAKVDAVKDEVDGKHSLMLTAIKEITEKALSREPRSGRKTDQ